MCAPVRLVCRPCVVAKASVETDYVQCSKESPEGTRGGTSGQ